jgi:hypothetical protein
MGTSLVIRMVTHGGAQCPGDTYHPWTPKPQSSPTTWDERGRCLGCVHCTSSVASLATRGATALSQPVPQVWRIARANRSPAPSRRLSTSSRPSSNCASITLRGAPRTGWQGARHGSPAGRYPRAPRFALSSAAVAWCPRHDTVDTLAIRVSPPARSWPPTLSGAPLARATAPRATGSSVIRSPWPMATAAFASAVKPSLQPRWPRASPCSPAGSQRAVYSSASAPTTVCPVPPTPWARSLNSTPGGSA